MAESIFLIDRQRRSHFFLRFAAALLIYFGAASGYYFFMQSLNISHPLILAAFWFGLFLLTLGAASFCWKLFPIELLFVGTAGYATEHIGFAVAKILQYITGMYADRIGVVLENLIFRFLIYAVVTLAVYRFIVKPNRRKSEMQEHDRRVVLMSFLILFSAIILSVYSDNILTYDNALTEIVCPAYGLLCSLLILSMEYYVFRENRLTREKSVMEQLLQIAEIQKESTKEAIDIINIKCHDLKHQMKVLMNMEDREERKEYIEEMRRAVSIYDAAYHTGCESLDYILREKTLISNEYQVAFSCMADGAALSFMHPADLYALMGNALDNALESVIREEEGKRVISLKISRHGNMVSIQLENTCSRNVEFEDGMPVTDKEDKRYHGFGVRSIRYVVEKYNGEFQMRVRNGCFRLDILLPSVSGDLT